MLLSAFLFATVLVPMRHALAQVITAADLQSVYVKLSYDDIKQDYKEVEGTWMSPSVLVIPVKSASLKNLNVDNAKALAKYENQLNLLKSKLWSALFGKAEPSRKTVQSLIDMVAILNIPEEMKQTITKFMLPNIYIYSETNYKLYPKLYSAKYSAASFDMSGVEKYVHFIKKHRQVIADRINMEYRVKSPFGLGDNVILSFLNFNQNMTELKTTYVKYLTLLNKYDLMKAERELSHLVKHSGNVPHLYDPIRVKLLIQDQKTNKYLQTLSTFEVPWEYGGCSEYPSISQLRAELVDRLGNHEFRYAPVTDPIFTHKALLQNGAANDEVKCKRACVDHLDSSLGFEVAVACGETGCVPLAMTISDGAVKKQMDVPLRRLPAFLFSAAITARWAGIQDIEKILAEIVVFSHTSSLSFIKRMLKMAAAGKYFPPHLLMYRKEFDTSVFVRVLMLVDAMTVNENDMEMAAVIRPNWERALMQSLDTLED